MAQQPSDQYRAELDFEITLSSGGTLRGRDFRMDIEHPGMTEDEFAAALGRELGLTPADQVDIHSRQVMRAPHQGLNPPDRPMPVLPDAAPALEPLPGRRSPATDAAFTADFGAGFAAELQSAFFEPEPTTPPPRTVFAPDPALVPEPFTPEPFSPGADFTLEPFSPATYPPSPSPAPAPPAPAPPVPAPRPAAARPAPLAPPGPAAVSDDDDVTGPIHAAGNGRLDHGNGSLDPGNGSLDQRSGLLDRRSAPATADDDVTDGLAAVTPLGLPTPVALRRADLSHVIEDGLVTYPGLPMAQISPDAVSAVSRTAYAPGVAFQIGEVTLCGITGTTLVSPFHRHPGADNLSELPLDKIAELDGVLVDVSGSGQRAIDRSALLPYDCRGKAVLIRTGWDQHWGTNDYYRNHPFLTSDAATYLAGTGAVLVGIDSLSIDDTGDPQRPAVSLLLGAGIPVCEHLTRLDTLPPSGFRFSAVPPKLRPMGSFPVRAHASWPVPDGR
jgi:arylformamidase